MPTCLLGLGSNVGDREATLRAALEEIDALPNVRLVHHSAFFATRPVGMKPTADWFVNAAAVVEASVEPLRFFEHLQRIETRYGRQREGRWTDRTLDIDLLLYGNEVMETAKLIVPHVRMSFRRFVLEPAVQIAPEMIHPVIGWPLERLLLHLNAARDQLVVLSPSETARQSVEKLLAERFEERAIERPTFKTADLLWPPAYCSWFALDPSANEAGASAASHRRALPYAAAAFPKLSILLDADGDGPTAAKSKWSAIVRRPGRGPTLRLQQTDPPTVESEIVAAVQSVWPDLGSSEPHRLK